MKNNKTKETLKNRVKSIKIESIVCGRKKTFYFWGTNEAWNNIKETQIFLSLDVVVLPIISNCCCPREKISSSSTHLLHFIFAFFLENWFWYKQTEEKMSMIKCIGNFFWESFNQYWCLVFAFLIVDQTIWLNLSYFTISPNIPASSKTKLIN